MTVRFSERSRFETTPNALSERVEARTAPYLDLTESNPTRAGLPVPTEAIARALAEGAAHPYAPDPLGPSSAREAVARELERTTGATVDPNRVLLTASTSEAYALLFQVLADPGDRVLVPAPSYPLFEHLARVEGLSAMPYELEYDGRWRVDPTALHAPRNARALLAVNPNNPTGHGISAADWGTLADAELPMIVDEVFLEYALGETRLASALGRPGPLRFVLGGLSKYAGLPHMKLAWTVVEGPDAEVRAALMRLEHLADLYLSVATPVAMALPAIFEATGELRARIRERLRVNLRALDGALAGSSGTRLEADGGWYAVVRVPETRTDEAWALTLLDAHDLLVQPGYFYDFRRGAFLVLSLLTPEDVFAEGTRRLRAALDRA